MPIASIATFRALPRTTPQAAEALGGFKRFPTWMWRNAECSISSSGFASITILRARRKPKVGFYGLDLYSMYASIEAVLTYLDRVDPAAAATARGYYACLSRIDHPYFGLAARDGMHPSCRESVMSALLEIQRQAAQYARLDGIVAEDQ